MFRKDPFRIRPRRLNIFDLGFTIIAALLVGSIVYAMTFVYLNDCQQGLWVRDAVGIPRCVKTQNLNLLIQ